MHRGISAADSRVRAELLVQSAVTMKPCDAAANQSARGGELAADNDPAIRMQGHAVESSGPGDERPIHQPIRLQPGEVCLRNTRHTAKGAREKELTVRLKRERMDSSIDRFGPSIERSDHIRFASDIDVVRGVDRHGARASLRLVPGINGKTLLREAFEVRSDSAVGVEAKDPGVSVR